MSLRGIVLAAASPPLLHKLHSSLTAHATPVLGVAQTQDAAVRLCRSLLPDVLVTHQHLIGGNGVALAQALQGLLPVVVLCPPSEAQPPLPPGTWALPTPFLARELLIAIRQAAAQGQQDRLSRVSATLEQQRALIADAKALLQARGMSEAQAHAALQKLAMDRRQKLPQAAQWLLMQHDAQPPQKG